MNPGPSGGDASNASGRIPQSADASLEPRALLSLPVWLLVLLLMAMALCLYGPTASLSFVEFDDPAYVRDNAHIAQGLTAESVGWALTSTDYQYNWHPLTWLSHALDVELFGLEAGRHHLVNALLHALNAALLFLALRSLSGRVWPSVLAAALFAVHPMRVESVVWIAQRKDLLAGTFFALTLLAWAGYVRAPSVRRYLFVAVSLAAGLMAKPTLVTLPFLLLLLDLWPLGRLALFGPAGDGGRGLGPRLREKLPLLALSAGSVLITLLTQSEGGAVRAGLPLLARLTNAAIAYVQYIGQFLFPHGLAVLYPHPGLVEPEASRLVPALFALLVLAFGLAGAIRMSLRWPWLLCGAGWFLGLLVPMIGLVQVGNQARADRYGYLALIGLELALAWSAAELWRRRPRLRTPTVALALAAVGTLAFLSARQIRVWRDSSALFQHALAVTEKNFVAHNQLGLVLTRAGDAHMEEALVHFRQAAAIRPGFYEAELNAGLAQHALGASDEALAAFERAIAARPEAAEARLNRALLLAAGMEWEQADAELARALERSPTLVDDPRARRLGQELAARLGGE